MAISGEPTQTSSFSRPTSTPPSPSLEAALLTACHRPQLDEAAAAHIRSLVRAHPDWDALLRLADFHGTSPLLRLGLETAPEEVPEAVRSVLTEHTAQFARRSLYASAELFRILDDLARLDIQVLTFKGPVLGQALYGDPALREFVDLDLMTRPEDVSRAVEALRLRGFEVESPRDGVDSAAWRRTNYAYTLTRAGDRVHVDLHWGFARRYFSMAMNTKLLWRETTVQRLLGHPVRTFTPEMLLLILCVHGAKSRPNPWPKLKWIFDVTAMAYATPGPDWQRTEELARTLGIHRILLLGLALAHDLLGAPVHSELRAAVADPRVARLAAEVRGQLFAPEPSLPALRRMWFDLRVRERVRDKLRYSWRRTLTPVSRDRELTSLPSRLSFFYVPLRLLRLARLYLLRPSNLRHHWKKKRGRGSSRNRVDGR